MTSASLGDYDTVNFVDEQFPDIVAANHVTDQGTIFAPCGIEQEWYVVGAKFVVGGGNQRPEGMSFYHGM